MSETVPSEPKPRKVVGRNVTIALGILCIILAVGVLGAISYYVLMINDKNTAISSLNSQIYDKNIEISSLDSQVTNLQNQVNDLTNTLNLGKSAVWIHDETISQPSSSYTTWTSGFSASYCGYVSVQVQTSTTTSTYVRAIYTAYGVHYDNQITVGTSGTAVFPVLPASIEIRIGNTNLFNGATETVTITYYY